MINFDHQNFQKITFSPQQIKQYFASAEHDLKIAQDSDLSDVIFKFAYDALLKIGIYLITKAGYKVKSRSGHHFKIIEKLAEILKDESISVLGNKMRQDRNVGLYLGGLSVGQKESLEYLAFVNSVFKKAAEAK
jgi:hypothetical protein